MKSKYRERAEQNVKQTYRKLFGKPALDVPQAEASQASRLDRLTRDPMFRAIENMEDFPNDKRQRILAEFVGAKIDLMKQRGEHDPDLVALHRSLTT